ncbi:MAG: hypothetical protein K2H59_06925 [Muribaculaceae bacterium]|nr:hypothetical protein [Muribaculaceae bacterium]
MKQIILYIILLFLLINCTNKGKLQTNSESDITESVIVDSVSIFGIKSPKNPLHILEILDESGILRIDRETLKISNDTLIGGIVSFEDIKFGINNPSNRGISFVSSRQDDAAYESLKELISKYYGDAEDEEWHNTSWNKNEVYIRIRPLRSEDGGLVMMWYF